MTPLQLFAIEAHARAHNGGLGDHALLDQIKCARDPRDSKVQRHCERSLAVQLEIMAQMDERPCVIVTLESCTTIPRDEIEALAGAVGSLAGHRHEYPLIRLLRRLAPQHETLAHLDRIAREHGYMQAGSDERADDGKHEVPITPPPGPLADLDSERNAHQCTALQLEQERDRHAATRAQLEIAYAELARVQAERLELFSGEIARATAAVAGHRYSAPAPADPVIALLDAFAAAGDRAGTMSLRGSVPADRLIEWASFHSLPVEHDRLCRRGQDGRTIWWTVDRVTLTGAREITASRDDDPSHTFTGDD